MLVPQALNIHIDRQSIQHFPRPADHHPVRPVRTAQHKPGQCIANPGKPQVFHVEQCQVGLPPNGNRADIRPPEAACRTLAGPTQRIEMCHRRGIIGQPVDHQRMPHPFHQVGAVVGGRTVNTEPDRRTRPLKLAGAAMTRRQNHVRRRAMAHPDPVRAEPVDLGIIEVDAMRQPGLRAEPAHIRQIVHRPATEHLKAEHVLVFAFAQMGVQPAVEFLSQRGAIHHQFARHRKR